MFEYKNDEPLSVVSWIGTILLLSIPVVNIIMILVWTFESGGNINRKNFASAYLVIILISTALGILIAVLSGPALMQFIDQFKNLGF